MIATKARDIKRQANMDKYFARKSKEGIRIHFQIKVKNTITRDSRQEQNLTCKYRDIKTIINALGLSKD